MTLALLHVPKIKVRSARRKTWQGYSGDDIVDNTIESVDDGHDSNLCDNVAAGQENEVCVSNDCLDYDFDENLEDHAINNASDKENIPNHLSNIPKVSLCQ